MRSFLWIGILLVVIWAVLRIALAVTSGMLHLLWILALVFLVMSLIGKFRTPRTP